MERIREIPQERCCREEFADYFTAVAEFLMRLEDAGRFLASSGMETASTAELKERNRALYEDVLP
jgi:hypothetical protein